MKNTSAAKMDNSETENTSLPLLHSWKGVYGFVLASFALWLLLLIVLTKMFS